MLGAGRMGGYGPGTRRLSAARFGHVPRGPVGALVDMGGRARLRNDLAAPGRTVHERSSSSAAREPASRCRDYADQIGPANAADQPRPDRGRNNQELDKIGVICSIT